MPSERSLIAQIGAHESWARTPDRSARTAPARAEFDRRFEREVDPDEVLDPAERARALRTRERRTSPAWRSSRRERVPETVGGELGESNSTKLPWRGRL